MLLFISACKADCRKLAGTESWVAAASFQVNISDLDMVFLEECSLLLRNREF